MSCKGKEGRYGTQMKGQGPTLDFSTDILVENHVMKTHHKLYYTFVCFFVDVLRIRSHGIHHHEKPPFGIIFFPSTEESQNLRYMVWNHHPKGLRQFLDSWLFTSHKTFGST